MVFNFRNVELHDVKISDVKLTYDGTLNKLQDHCPIRTHGTNPNHMVGWLDDRHGPSPILYDTVPLFVYIDQLLWHCIFVYSNAYWQLVYLLRDVFLHCFCLLAEPYETINQSINLNTTVCDGFWQLLYAEYLCTSWHVHNLLYLRAWEMGCWPTHAFIYPGHLRGIFTRGYENRYQASLASGALVETTMDFCIVIRI